MHIELFTQVHYRESIDGDAGLSALYKDVFKYHWLEESQHVIIDEVEFRKVDHAITPEERDEGVDQFIELVGAIDGILQGQANADATYFCAATSRTFSTDEAAKISELLLKAYG